MLHLFTFNNLQNCLSQFVHRAEKKKLNKVAKKPSDPSISKHCYWSMLKNYTK